MLTKLENVLSAALTVAAVAIVGIEIHREFRPPPLNGAELRKSAYVAEWKNLLAGARTIGNPHAAITLIEFTDFECPFCKRFNETLDVIRRKYPQDVAVALVHFPLPGHRQARAAAYAVECAALAGRFPQAVDAIFEVQDSLGKKPWSAFARAIGLADTLAFVHCMADSSSLGGVARGVKVGTQAGVNATPTVILNGWRYGVAPPDSELFRAIDDLLAKRKPYPDFPRAALR